jgi:5,6-dimethylbenzimidazole synthase
LVEGLVMLPFTEEEKRAIYRTIRERRDVRSGFLEKPLEDDLLHRLLCAAHHAPSVGFMQPWNFILVRQEATRRKVHHLFEEANRAAQCAYDEKEAHAYSNLKLAGLLEAPQHLCVVCDNTTGRGRGLGRSTMPETAVYSVVCAIQNLWLAARAEGVGVGWVSILEPEKVKEILAVPAHMTLVAYLCLGYVDHFYESPELEILGWEQRAPLESLVHHEIFTPSPLAAGRTNNREQ